VDNVGDGLWTPLVRRWTTVALSPPASRAHPPGCGSLGTTGDGDRAGDLRRRPVIHNPQPLLLLLVRFIPTVQRKRAT
jgi:hypothetical protein